MKTVYTQERWGMFGLIITNLGMVAILIFQITRGDMKLVFLSSCILLYCIVLLINFFKTFIAFDDSSVYYRTLFLNKSMRFDEVRKIESTAELSGGSPSGVRGKYRTTLYSDSDKIAIGIKTFSKKTLTEFATALVTRCVNADIDDSTRFMMEGKMPSAIINYKKKKIE